VNLKEGERQNPSSAAKTPTAASLADQTLLLDLASSEQVSRRERRMRRRVPVC
jgi:hypothetical protein